MRSFHRFSLPGRGRAAALLAATLIAGPALADSAAEEAEEQVRENPFIFATTAATTGVLIGEEMAEDDYARARDFADSRYIAIRRDAASGGGENLHALATLLDADNPRAFGDWMQSNYADLFAAEANRDELVTRIVAMRG